MADSSGYFFDVQEWNGSRAVQRMSFSEQGVYKAMLNYQWEKRNLPDDPQAVAELIAFTDTQAAEVVAAWPVVRRKFVTSKGDASCLYNAKLERVRRAQRENKRRRQESGQRGGNASAQKRRERLELQASNATRPLSSAVANPSDLTRQDKTSSDQTRLEIRAGFDRWWAQYPRKEGKEPAWKIWEHMKPSPALQTAMIRALSRQIRSAQWSKDDGAFIPHAKTWLFQQRWTDQIGPVESPAVAEYFAWVCPHDPRCASQAVCEIVARKASA